jgi:hypothetical protein
MPLYEYQCQDCGATLELLQAAGAPAPRRCGFRCPLGPDSEHEARGFGALSRLVSTFSTVQSDLVNDNPGPRELAGRGMAVYANEGGGKLRRIEGNEAAPEWLDVGDPHAD